VHHMHLQGQDEGQRKLLRLHPGDGSTVLSTPAGTYSSRALATEATGAGPCHAPSALDPPCRRLVHVSTVGRGTYAEGFSDSGKLGHLVGHMGKFEVTRRLGQTSLPDSGALALSLHPDVCYPAS
jgi:hypothetical protein